MIDKEQTEKIAMSVFQREDGDYQVNYWDGEVKIIPEKETREHPILVGTIILPLGRDIAAKDARIAEMEKRLAAAEKVARKACKMIARFGDCPYESTMTKDCETLVDDLGCDFKDNCNTNAAHCWREYFRLGLDQTGDVQDES
jgi:hypothetical protein